MSVSELLDGLTSNTTNHTCRLLDGRISLPETLNQFVFDELLDPTWTTAQRGYLGIESRDKQGNGNVTIITSDPLLQASREATALYGAFQPVPSVILHPATSRMWYLAKPPLHGVPNRVLLVILHQPTVLTFIPHESTLPFV